IPTRGGDGEGDARYEPGGTDEPGVRGRQAAELREHASSPVGGRTRRAAPDGRTGPVIIDGGRIRAVGKMRVDRAGLAREEVSAPAWRLFRRDNCLARGFHCRILSG